MQTLIAIDTALKECEIDRLEKIANALPYMDTNDKSCLLGKAEQLKGGIILDFPKATMSTKELKEMGFSITWLRDIANEVGYPLAVRMSHAPNSKLMFNTKELDKYLKRSSNMMQR